MSLSYDSRFAKEVVDKFLETVPRGWVLFQNQWPNLNRSRVAFIFRTSPKRWNVLKRSLKLGERLMSSEYYRDNEKLIIDNVKTSVEYQKKRVDELAKKSPMSTAIARIIAKEYLQKTDT